MTPSWAAESNGNLRLAWASPDDLLTYVNQVVAPAAGAYGYRVVLERIPADEALVDRA